MLRFDDERLLSLNAVRQELMGVAHTGPSQEGSVISMNKSLTKEVLREHNLPTLPSVSVKSADLNSATGL